MEKLGSVVADEARADAKTSGWAQVASVVDLSLPFGYVITADIPRVG
ncbi:hypothetical protein ACF09C_24635 [Streptomyces sp. NPDC014870]